MKRGGFTKRTIRDVPLDGKVVLVRTDYNVPIEDGDIKDDYRVRSSLPTIKTLLARGCTVVIVSHLGRPDGKVVEELSLEPVAERLSELLGKRVKFVHDCVGDKVTMAVRNSPKSSVLLLENVRFHSEDEANDSMFAKELARSCSAKYFVQDGFGVVHRAQASTSTIAQFLPSVAGLLLEKECKIIFATMESPRRPLVAIVGGAKVSDKIQMIERLIGIADKLIIGGAMANNFLKHKGYQTGKSLVEKEASTIIENIYKKVALKVGKDKVDDYLLLPKDVAVAPDIDVKAKRITKKINDVTEDDIILDIGSATMNDIDIALQDARSVVWNGPLGYSELPNFAHGSARLALYLASHPDITSIVGGGDTADFVRHWDAMGGRSFSFVSTGGGASLELMAGNKLPGIETLMDA